MSTDSKYLVGLIVTGLVTRIAYEVGFNECKRKTEELLIKVLCKDDSKKDEEDKES